MKVVHYVALALLASSPLCYGITSHTLKHASSGMGKTFLGLICAHVAVSTALAEAVFVSSNEPQNVLLVNGEWCHWNFEQNGIRGLLFEKGQGPWINEDLICLLSRVTFMGCSAYAAGKCCASAYHSLKRAYNQKESASQPKSGHFNPVSKQSQDEQVEAVNESVEYVSKPAVECSVVLNKEVSDTALETMTD